MRISVAFCALEVGLRCLEVTDQVVQRVPGMNCLRALALDTLFGPEEAMDYVSTTAPPTLSPQ